MKKETRDFLKQMADDQEAKIALEQQRPAVIEKAIKEYNALGAHLKRLIDEFNDDPEAKRSKVALRLDEPLHYNHSIYYAIRQTIDERAIAYPKGQMLLLIAPVDSDFEHIRLVMQVWQSNLQLRAIPENLSGYAPGQAPKRALQNSYKMVIVDKTYGWVPDGHTPQQPLSTQGLFFNLIHSLITTNAKA